MADKSTRKPTDREINAAMKNATALDRFAARMLQQVDPSYDDRRVLSKQDAEFQRIIDRQLEYAKGVAGNQIVDFIASIRSENNRSVGRPPKKDNGLETAELFTENIGDIFGYFQDIYKNRYLEVSDLKFIAKFIPSIGESIRIYLDAIVSSDDVSQIVTRNIKLPKVVEEGDKTQVNDTIARLEKDHKLLQKLKIAYKKAMVTGTFYVYHVAYKDLFAMYSQGVADGKIERNGNHKMGGNARTPIGDNESRPGSLTNNVGKMPKPGKHNPLGIAEESVVSGIDAFESAADYVRATLHPSAQPAKEVWSITDEPALEGFGPETAFLARDGFIKKCNYQSGVMESAFTNLNAIVSDYKSNIPRDKEGNQETVESYQKRLRASVESDMPNIYFNYSPIPFDIEDDVAMVKASESYHTFFNLRKDVDEDLEKLSHSDGNQATTDATMDMLHPTKARRQNFSDISGTYLKWIDYKYMVPVEVLGKKMGYYHIITTTKRKKNGKGTKPNEVGGILSTGSMSLFDQLDVSERRKEEAMQNIVDTISDCILDQFSPRFVKKNAAFKKLIAECIIANGLVDNDYMIQFIPADQVIEFKCNEDENGKGESILSEAMFPAHLLLSIVVTKMLNYINKGGNRTIAHISSGRVNRSLGNQVNRVLRDLQAGNVTATDLLSSSMVFSKVTRDQNLAMPKDQQGNKLVEFEIQEGQQIELDTDYERMLERWCMIATGMPPTVMDYESNVDVAKKVVSDNIRVAGRVASLQADLEAPSTELYRVLIRDCAMDDTLKAQVVNSLEFSLPRPRVLANQNNSEAINTAYQNAQTIANVLYGEDMQDEQAQASKTEFVQLAVEDEIPYLNWEKYREMKKQADALAREKQVKKEADGETPDNGMGGMDMGGADMGGGDFGGDMGMGGGDMGMDMGGPDEMETAAEPPATGGIPDNGDLGEGEGGGIPGLPSLDEAGQP